MARSTSLRWRLLLALAGCLLPALAGVALLGGAMAAPAGAEGYGELGRFGRKGTGPGEFKLPEDVHAFGVDTEDESVAGHTSIFVGDEPSEGKEFRIQKLIPKLNGKGELEAESAASRLILAKPVASRGLEGIAIDPALKRVYLMAVGERSFSNKFDRGTAVAATLYAFSTETLEPAPETKEENGVKGVLAGPAVLHAQSDATSGASGHQQALLEPRGIAVDPSTHDVIIVGAQDDQEKLVGGEEEEPILRAALQRVKSNGEVAGRYVDTTDCFGFGVEELGKPPVCEGLEGEEGSPAEAPTSPVVSQTGRVYVETYDRIWEIPTMANAKGEKEFATKTPKPFFKISALDEILELTPLPGGGGLSFVHEQGAPAGEATLYAYGHANAVEGGARARGVLELKYSEAGGVATLSELGWTGGQTPASGKGKCTISILGEPSVAGGVKGEVFVFDPDLPIEELTGEKDPHVTGFGPGGSGCPAASVSKPSATVEGNKVEGAVLVGKPVTLSSELIQTNALSVEWRFENLTTHEAPESTPLSGEEYHTTKVEHTFIHEGEYKITEIVHTDDLATAEVKVEQTLKVEEPKPTARFSFPEPATVGASAKFEGHVSDESGKSALPLKYVWSFGDGSKESSSEAAASPASFSAEHTYQQPGTYTVTLTVTDKLGFGTKVTHEVRVQAPAEEPKETEAEAKKKQEEAAAAAAKKHQEEEAAAVAAKKHQEEEAAAAAAKAKAEAEAAAKKKREEEAANKKPPTRAQLLAKALKQCKKDKPKSKRAKCEATAKKKYASKPKGKKRKKK